MIPNILSDKVRWFITGVVVLSWLACMFFDTYYYMGIAIATLAVFAVVEFVEKREIKILLGAFCLEDVKLCKKALSFSKKYFVKSILEVIAKDKDMSVEKLVIKSRALIIFNDALDRNNLKELEDLSQTATKTDEELNEIKVFAEYAYIYVKVNYDFFFGEKMKNFKDKCNQKMKKLNDSQFETDKYDAKNIWAFLDIILITEEKLQEHMESLTKLCDFLYIDISEY